MLACTDKLSTGDAGTLMGTSTAQLYTLMYLEFPWLLVPEQHMDPGKMSACDARRSSGELV